MAEVQALVMKTAFGNPRRTSTGFDFNRTALILAVLEKRGAAASLATWTLTSTWWVVCGWTSPAADLPVALALVSNLTDRVICGRCSRLWRSGRWLRRFGPSAGCNPGSTRLTGWGSTRSFCPVRR